MKKTSIVVFSILIFTLFIGNVNASNNLDSNDFFSQEKRIVIEQLDEQSGYDVKKAEEGKTIITDPSGSVTTVYQNYTNGKVIITSPVSTETENYETGEIITQGTVSIYGSLKSGEETFYGPYQAEAGDNITLSISWAPSDQDMFLGVNKQGLPGISIGYSGGSATVSQNISESGSYIVSVIADFENTEAVDYNGFITYP